jgi:hypothetical protein
MICTGAVAISAEASALFATAVRLAPDPIGRIPMTTIFRP